MKNEYSVCVIGGCGHVGLPLAAAFASKNIDTVVYDINRRSVEMVERGEPPFKEEGLEPLLKKVLNRSLFISSDPMVIGRSKYVIVVIGTPVDEFLNPKVNDIFVFLKQYVKYFRKGQYLILRSTLYPGTTQKVNEYLKRKKLPMKVSFCPERIAEGKALEEIFDLPQIISAFDRGTETEMKKLFGRITRDVVTVSPMEAETAKLFTNVWRYIQFAIPNQFLIVALKSGLDFYKIFNAIKFKYPRAKGFYGPGFAAGPCLFKDTMQLAAFNNNDFMLGHSAMLVNEGLPKQLVDHLKSRYGLSKLTVGVLGMAFKADSDDPRSSLSYKLKKILELECSQVLCSDIYLKDPSFVPAAKLAKDCDIVVVAAPHSEYRKLRFGKRTKVLDIWNFYGKGMEF
ncbi:MAG TPA: nucleotide sugar dehydrogenase [Candidatus Omnitrophota bacterium]|nr:nucleotide sugar dehydrogenase [Candidatus Omnitrophota bacterium]